MTQALITFQGAVPPWECDIVEHFTVAYYYEKFQSATWRFLQEAGVDPTAEMADWIARMRSLPGMKPPHELFPQA